MHRAVLHGHPSPEVSHHRVHAFLTLSSPLFPFSPIFFFSATLYHFSALLTLSPLPPPGFSLPLAVCAASHPPSPLPLLCAPLIPASHQSLALASPSRTYGMMDRRASGASEARGHLPGAPRCRGSRGPARQPRPRTSVSRHSHTTCAQSKLLCRSQLNLGPTHFAAAFVSRRRAVWIVADAVRSGARDKRIKGSLAMTKMTKRELCCLQAKRKTRQTQKMLLK